MTSPSEPRISVIIPAYNAGKYIYEALQSVLVQTLSPSEIIVVDDGSTDDTERQVNAVGSSLIRYVRQPNSGVSVARNKGMSLATGDFIAFLDADDLWRPEMLAAHAAMHARCPDLVFSFSDFERFDHSTRLPIGTQFVFYRELQDINTEALTRDSWLISGDPFCALVSFGDFPGFTPAMMFNRSRLGDLHFDGELKVCEDAHFVLRACTLGDVAFTRAVLADIRRHDSNVTANYTQISLDKLTALLRLQSCDLRNDRRRALDARISRAHFDVARLYARSGYRQQALWHWKLAVSRPVSLSKRIRSSAGLAFDWLGL